MTADASSACVVVRDHDRVRLVLEVTLDLEVGGIVLLEAARGDSLDEMVRAEVCAVDGLVLDVQLRADLARDVDRVLVDVGHLLVTPMRGAP